MALIHDNQKAQFHEQGYFLTDPVFTPGELEALAAEFDRVHRLLIEDAVSGGDATSIRLARFRPFIGRFHERSALAAEFIKAPFYLEACAALIGPDADLYYNQAVIKPPQQGMAFAWHQDSAYNVTEPLRYITCWTAISRTTVENGCIWIVPGSHRRGLLEHRFDETERTRIAEVDEKDAVSIEMQPGQVAVFSSLMLHKSGPNTSDEIRRAYVPQYHHMDAVSVETGKPWGDQFAVLRGGVCV